MLHGAVVHGHRLEPRLGPGGNEKRTTGHPRPGGGLHFMHSSRLSRKSLLFDHGQWQFLEGGEWFFGVGSRKKPGGCVN